MAQWAVGPGYRVYPPRLNIFAEIIDRHVAEGRGDNAALWWSNGRWTFCELQAETSKFAAGLRSLGLQRGDRVILRSRNSARSVVAILATLKLGYVPVLTNSLLTETELDYILDNSDAKVALVADAFAAPLRSLQSKGRLDKLIILDGVAKGAHELSYDDVRQPDQPDQPTADTDAMDPAFMLYSSGTTGRPKGIVHAHRWVVTVGDPSCLQMEFTTSDIVATAGEFSFMGNFGHALIFPLYSGSGLAIFEERVSPEAVLSFLEQSRSTIFVSVPTFYRNMLAAEGFTSALRNKSLRYMVATGEPLGAAVFESWRKETGITIYEIYGVSEFEVLLSNGPGIPVKPGSAGKVAPDVGAKLLNDSLEEVGPNESGVLMIERNDPGLYLGYHKQPDRWRTQHRGNWYYTGDVMRRDEDGYHFYLGREDDLFKSRGYLISPQEIENVLQRHPAVAEAAVIGQPDQLMGNTIAAYVVLKTPYKGSDALSDEIRKFAAEHTSPYKVPRVLTFIGEMPKNPVGKILRRALRASPPDK
jgi:acyl-coenzyme A synthetase/AMP-(fatty) acid ligase